jgi:hypothetical protein
MLKEDHALKGQWREMFFLAKLIKPIHDSLYVMRVPSILSKSVNMPKVFYRLLKMSQKSFKCTRRTRRFFEDVSEYAKSILACTENSLKEYNI